MLQPENVPADHGGRTAAPASDIAIAVQGVSKSFAIFSRPEDRLKQMLVRGRQQYFRSFEALREVSFEVRRGETFGIVGRNGSGKSTLLQIICGTLTPTTGNVRHGGRIAPLLELGAGFNPEFTGRENIRINGLLLGLSEREIDERRQDMIDFAGIGDFIDQPVKTYSTGMYVRLAFAVAINSVPDILIIDEALAVGDESFQRKCYARIEALKKSGATILFVSHAAQTVMELCDRALVLDAGEPLLIAEPKIAVGYYQKLLFADPAQNAAIRAEIARLRAGIQPAAAMPPAASPAGAAAAIAAVEPELELFDPGLKTESAVIFPENGARIESFGLHTPAGRAVNRVRSCRNYSFRYRVRFLEDAEMVRFHTMIKNISGAHLGGHAFPVETAAFKAGDCVDIHFDFVCHLNPGQYFMNCAISGNGRAVMHRIIDVMTFVVMSEGPSGDAGNINFAYKPSYVVTDR